MFYDAPQNPSGGGIPAAPGTTTVGSPDGSQGGSATRREPVTTEVTEVLAAIRACVADTGHPPTQHALHRALVAVESALTRLGGAPHDR